MTLQAMRARKMTALQSSTTAESRVWPDISTAARQMRAEPIGCAEVALLVVPQLMMGAVVLLGAFIVTVMGG